MEALKCLDVRWKGPEERNKPALAASTAKHPDSRSQISRWMQPMYMRSVSFWGIYFGQPYQRQPQPFAKSPYFRRPGAPDELNCEIELQT